MQVIYVAFAASFLVVALVSCKPALDENLCPVNTRPSRQTVMLLDTSDPLTPKHQAELERLVADLQQPKSEDFYVAPGQALVVYRLAADWQNLMPVIEVCNPGDRPDDWNWKKGLTQGKVFALHNWKRFEDRIKKLYPDESAKTMRLSPILENLGVIVPRHAPSKRSPSAGGADQVHLILFSDLLQHSDLLSHYGAYPKANTLPTIPKLRELITDLTHVKVSLFRLERSKYSRWQTRDHYYWWTHLVRAFKGEVRWQESL